jgi:hypothetical protein
MTFVISEKETSIMDRAALVARMLSDVAHTNHVRTLTFQDVESLGDVRRMSQDKLTGILAQLQSVSFDVVLVHRYKVCFKMVKKVRFYRNGRPRILACMLRNRSSAAIDRVWNRFQKLFHSHECTGNPGCISLDEATLDLVWVEDIHASQYQS